MGIAEELTAHARAGAPYIERVGWTRREEVGEEGRVCLTGAIMHCRPPGLGTCI